MRLGLTENGVTASRRSRIGSLMGDTHRVPDPAEWRGSVGTAGMAGRRPFSRDALLLWSIKPAGRRPPLVRDVTRGGGMQGGAPCLGAIQISRWGIWEGE